MQERSIHHKRILKTMQLPSNYYNFALTLKPKGMRQMSKWGYGTMPTVQPLKAGLVAIPMATAVLERSLQQSEILKNRREPTGRGESSGSQVLFYPKFHRELNHIEP